MSKAGAAAVLSLLFLSAFFLAPPAPADEGRIPIYGPTSIAQPGHYVVTRNFCFGSSVVAPCIVAISGITIASSDVTLDLNGRTISTSEGQVILRIDTSAATRGVTIRNGRLVGGGSGVGIGNIGILADNTNPLQVTIEGVELRDLGGDGIDINSAKDVRIQRCLIQNANTGIEIRSPAGAFSARIADNTLTGLAGFGMWVEGLQAGQILRNVVKEFGTNQPNAAGIYLRSNSAAGDVGGNLVEGNTLSAGARSIDDDGIAVIYNPGASCRHNLLVDNLVQGNGRFGLLVTTDENRIERNIAGGNGSDGIRIGDSSVGARNDLEGNQAQGNVGCGIGFTNFSSHIYRNNVMRNNTGGDVCGFGAPSTNAGGNICTAACP